jgi:hypothetical protein
MAITPVQFFTETSTRCLDSLLYEVCEELQLGKFRYKQAEDRYKAVSKVMEAKTSPFRLMQPRIYLSLIKISRTRRISNLQEGTVERIAIGSSHALMAPIPLWMDSQCARLA